MLAAGAAGAAIRAPYVVSASALGGGGRPAPSERITLGMIGVGRQGTFANLRSGDVAGARPGEIQLPLKSEKRDFIDCIKSRARTLADAEVGHRTNSLCHLGHIAVQLGRKLRWDPDAERFPDDDEANRLLGRCLRSPWRL